jgi:hypothetical protein
MLGFSKMSKVIHPLLRIEKQYDYYRIIYSDGSRGHYIGDLGNPVQYYMDEKRFKNISSVIAFVYRHYYCELFIGECYGRILPDNTYILFHNVKKIIPFTTQLYYYA